MGLVVDSRLKNLDVGILVLWIESEVEAIEHNASAE